MANVTDSQIPESDPVLEFARRELESVPGAFNEFKSFYNGTTPSDCPLLEQSRQSFRVESIISCPDDVGRKKRRIIQLVKDWLEEYWHQAPDSTDIPLSKMKPSVLTGVESMPPTPTEQFDIPAPVQRQRAQELALLAAMRDTGYNPKAIPKAPPNSKGGIKREMRDKLVTPGGFTRNTFIKTWQRLRNQGEIADIE